MTQRSFSSAWLAPAAAAFFSAAALAVAFVAEYVFLLLPCVLCIWERWAFGLALAGGLAGLALSRHPAAWRWSLRLAILGFLLVMGISIYHVGVEQGWWSGTAECSGSIAPGMDREALREAILNAPKVACTDASWSLWGISIAGFNVIFSPLFAAATWLLMRRRTA